MFRTYLESNYKPLKLHFKNWCQKNLNDKTISVDDLFNDAYYNCVVAVAKRNIQFVDNSKCEGYFWCALRNIVFKINEEKKKSKKNVDIQYDNIDFDQQNLTEVFSLLDKNNRHNISFTGIEPYLNIIPNPTNTFIEEKLSQNLDLEIYEWTQKNLELWENGFFKMYYINSYTLDEMVIHSGGMSRMFIFHSIDSAKRKVSEQFGGNFHLRLKKNK